MSITDKIGSFDFWGMLIPGCTTLWGVRIICIECNTIHAYYSNWHAMPWMHNDLFKWSVFLVAGYIVGLAISIIMDRIWEMLGCRNNPKRILNALARQKKRNPTLYTPQIFNDMKTDTVITYYTMYNEVDAKYPNNPIGTLERQVAFMRNMIIPFVILIIACFWQDWKIAVVLSGITVAGIICLTFLRQTKIYQVILEYYATLPEIIDSKSKNETIMDTQQVVTKAEKETDTTQMFKNMWYKIKQHLERKVIYYLILSVVLIGGIMFWALYLPKVQNMLSSNSADWGNFGAFFWGFGSMGFCALNVYVFWLIHQQMLRDNLVRDLRTLAVKIREQNTNDEKITAGLIESFKFAVGATIESRLLSKKAEKCVKRLLTHLKFEKLDYGTAPYYCEIIIYSISINKSVDSLKSDTFAEIGLMAKLHQWDEESEAEVNENAEGATIDGLPRRSFEDYLHGELLAVKRLSTKFPKAKVYPQKTIPNTNLVMDALVVPVESGNEIIVEIKSRLNERSAQIAVQHLRECQQAYQNAYNKKPDLAVAFMEDPAKSLSKNVMETIIKNEFDKYGIYII